MAASHPLSAVIRPLREPEGTKRAFALGNRDEFRYRCAMPYDDNLFALLYLFEQPGKVGFSFVDIIGCRNPSHIAAQIIGDTNRYT